MPEPILNHCRILVVEDEYLLADELRRKLEGVGAVVLGPVGTVNDAMAMINSEIHIDGAVVDVNLRGEMAYPAADLLLQRAIPFLFTTGYDASALSPRFEGVPRCEKPLNMSKVAETIGHMLGS